MLTVYGHEGAGVVQETGPGVTLVRPGDPVVVSLLRACGRCHYCALGDTHLCEGEFALKSESRLRNCRGETVHRLACAGFAEQAVVHESQLVRVPDDLPLDRACSPAA